MTTESGSGSGKSGRTGPAHTHTIPPTPCTAVLTIRPPHGRGAQQDWLAPALVPSAVYRDIVGLHQTLKGRQEVEVIGHEHDMPQACPPGDVRRSRGVDVQAHE